MEGQHNLASIAIKIILWGLTVFTQYNPVGCCIASYSRCLWMELLFNV